MVSSLFLTTSSRSLKEIVHFLAHSTEKGGLYGLKGSAAAFLLASALRSGARTVVAILPDGDSAQAWATDVRFYAGEDELSRNPLQDQVIRYPSSDVLPYSFGGFENDIWIDRMASLFRLAEGTTPRVVVVGLDALVRKIIPSSALREATFSLAVGQDMDRDEIIRRLVAAGYSRAPLVEDAGDFSVRGFILDLYPPLYPYPVRVEQMGDRIESIRLFDPSNQRSLDNIPSIQVSPIHVLIPDDPSRERGLKRLLEKCEARGVEKRVRQRLLDDFRHRVRFPGAEFYLPYFFPNSETLLDYIPADCTVIVPDGETITRSFEDLHEEMVRGWQSAVEEGLPVPDPDDLYLSREEFLRRIAALRTVEIADLEMEETGRATYRMECETNLDVRRDLVKAQGYDSGMASLVKRLKDWRDDGSEVFLVSHTQGQAQRLLNLLEPYDLDLDYRGAFDSYHLDSDPTPGIRVYVGALSSGFRLLSARRVVLTEEEIFGPRVRTLPRKRARGAFISSLTDLVEGEPVVHEDYGIGIFRGLVNKEFDGVPGEVMVIEYAGGDLLYHPVERLQVIQKYISGSEAPPGIDRLGGKGWAKTKAKVKKSIKEMARELLNIYAKRQTAKRDPYSPTDETFAAFEASFEFEETPDQSKAIQDVMESMDTDRPMDRLVCGDVGYGKTEVALRAAFRTIMDGKQVAVLVPTTVLAQQHYQTFCRRFSSHPITVEVLSRFRNAADQKDILKKLEKGTLDLVVATHKLLQKDVVFKNLGLLVVDEEQRFGVAHKEKIKKYKAHVDVLTLTATPIPRTLNLSLSGLRDLSVIETPPANRQSIRTHVVKQSDEVIREALVREINRGGQAFFLHNRVQTIHRRAEGLRRLVPEARIGVAHGQMADRELEQVMLDFVTGKFNVLVCTSIIESGLDIPRANTIMIERADTFGLADLYQIRGRVGRSHVRAYAYLLTPPETLMTPDAVKRLAVIQEYSNLGQGFRIAMRDLEIRGSGNILGTSQSGHVAQVGYEMYLDLLEQAIQEMKGEEPPSRIDPEIHLKLEAYIPEDYVPDTQQRMNLYKRLSKASEATEVDAVEEEILDLYGKAPVEVSHLIQVMRVRLAMKQIRILRLDYTGQEMVFTFDTDTRIGPDVLMEWVRQDPQLRLIPDYRFACRIGMVDAEARINAVLQVLDILGNAIEHGKAALPLSSDPRQAIQNRKVAGLKK